MVNDEGDRLILGISLEDFNAGQKQARTTLSFQPP